MLISATIKFFLSFYVIVGLIYVFFSVVYKLIFQNYFLLKFCNFSLYNLIILLYIQFYYIIIIFYYKTMKGLFKDLNKK